MSNTPTDSNAPAQAPEPAPENSFAATFAPVETALQETETEPKSAPPAPVAPNASAMNTAIDAWFAAQINNSPASRDTVIYNHIRAAVDDLKTRLAAL